MQWEIRFVFIALAMLMISGRCFGGDNVVVNGDFAQGAKGWGGVGSDDKMETAVVEAEGVKGMKLVRKTAGAHVAIDQSVKLKAQTLYRFSVTGFGKAPVIIRLRPESSKDPEFANLFKNWAVTSAPMAASEKLVTSTLDFDSGLKADQTSVSVFLDEKDPGEYVVNSVSLTELGSSAPTEHEQIILHLGDSITITSYLPFEERVDAVLKTLLAKEAVGSFRQINYGVDGEYVKELLDTKRYQKVVKENLPRVDIAVIRYGANDTRFGTPEDYKKELGLLCTKLKSDYPKIKIVLGTGPYLKGNDDVNLRQYGPYWKVIRELAGEKKLPVADIYAAFDRAQSPELCRSAGDMHPSAKGVGLMAETIARELKPLLPPP